jgi:hypothetical protein
MPSCIRSDLESGGSALPAAGSACGAFSRSAVSPPLQASWRCFAWSGAFSRLLTVPLAVPCCSEHHHQVAWAVVGCLVCLAVPRLVFASPAKIPPGGVVSDLPSLNAVTWGWRLPTPHLLEALGFGAVPQHTQYLPY